MHRLIWDDLQYVLAVAETGSLSSAARALGVHHATVLRRIAAFEEHCGVKVFERGVRGYHLTPESSHILSAVRNIDEMIEKLRRNIASQEDSVSGPLKVTTTDSLSAVAIMKYCTHFTKKYPAISVELMSRNDEQDLSRLESDIAIRPAAFLSPDLEGEYACDLTFAPYASQDYLNQSEILNDVVHHDWLGLSGLIKNVGFSDWMNSTIPPHKFAFHADSFLTLAALAEQGQGVAIIPCCLGDTSKKLVRIKHLVPNFSTGIWVAAHPDMAGSAKIQAAISFFVSAIRNEKTLFEGHNAKQ